MISKLKILLFFLLLANISFGFRFKNALIGSVADCSNAIEVQHFQTSNIQFVGNAGSSDELSPFFSELTEVNSVWLKIEPKLKGDFNMSFFTQENFDFEYYVFKETTFDFCSTDLSASLVYSDSSKIVKMKLLNHYC